MDLNDGFLSNAKQQIKNLGRFWYYSFKDIMLQIRGEILTPCPPPIFLNSLDFKIENIMHMYKNISLNERIAKIVFYVTGSETSLIYQYLTYRYNTTILQAISMKKILINGNLLRNCQIYVLTCCRKWMSFRMLPWDLQTLNEGVYLVHTKIFSKLYIKKIWDDFQSYFEILNQRKVIFTYRFRTFRC